MKVLCAMFSSSLWETSQPGSLLTKTNARVANTCFSLTLPGTLKALPQANLDTVVYLFDHFTRVVEHSDINKMVAPALATCLGPSLLTPAETDLRKIQAAEVVSLARYCTWHLCPLRLQTLRPTHDSSVQPPHSLF
jgi:hypothetical protein